VVHGEDSLDEVSITGRTFVSELKDGEVSTYTIEVSELKDGEVSTYTIEPEDFGLPRASISEIKGGDAETNGKIVLDVLQGEPGARRDIVLLNAAAALVAAGMAGNFREGINHDS